MPGMGEWIVILIVVMIFFGVGKLPEVFGQLGAGVKAFKDASEGKKSREDDEEEDDEDERPRRKRARRQIAADEDELDDEPTGKTEPAKSRAAKSE
jgi:sec-independent protein translocase protein TatA